MSSGRSDLEADLRRGLGISWYSVGWWKVSHDLTKCILDSNISIEQGQNAHHPLGVSLHRSILLNGRG